MLGKNGKVNYTENDFKTWSEVEPDEMPDEYFRGSLGIVFRLIPFSSLMIMRLREAYPEPKPPVWTDPDSGRSETNWDDKTYLKTLEEHNMRLGVKLMQYALGRGVEIVYTPPDIAKKISTPESNDWIEEELEFSEGAIDLTEDVKTTLGRYATWLRTKALVGRDADRVFQKIMKNLGLVPERSVNTALAGFPGEAGRPVDPGLAAEQEPTV